MNYNVTNVPTIIDSHRKEALAEKLYLEKGILRYILESQPGMPSIEHIVLAKTNNDVPVGVAIIAKSFMGFEAHAFVKKEFRRKGIGKMLLRMLRPLAEDLRPAVYAKTGIRESDFLWEKVSWLRHLQIEATPEE